jgi:hypothetical protein
LRFRSRAERIAVAGGSGGGGGGCCCGREGRPRLKTKLGQQQQPAEDVPNRAEAGVFTGRRKTGEKRERLVMMMRRMIMMGSDPPGRDAA